jgi:hypothetical protein
MMKLPVSYNTALIRVYVIPAIPLIMCILNLLKASYKLHKKRMQEQGMCTSYSCQAKIKALQKNYTIIFTRHWIKKQNNVALYIFLLFNAVAQYSDRSKSTRVYMSQYQILRFCALYHTVTNPLLGNGSVSTVWKPE